MPRFWLAPQASRSERRTVANSWQARPLRGPHGRAPPPRRPGAWAVNAVAHPDSSVIVGSDSPGCQSDGAGAMKMCQSRPRRAGNMDRWMSTMLGTAPRAGRSCADQKLAVGRVSAPCKRTCLLSLDFPRTRLASVLHHSDSMTSPQSSWARPSTSMRQSGQRRRMPGDGSADHRVNPSQDLQERTDLPLPWVEVFLGWSVSLSRTLEF